MATITLDLDDVIADFVGTFCRWLRKQGRTLTPEDFHTYRFEKVVGCSKDEAMRIVTQFYESREFEDMPLVPGAQTYVDLLAKDDKVFIVTARLRPYHKQTEDYVKAHFEGIQGVFIAAPDEKDVVCKRLRTAAHLDDSVDVVRSLAVMGTPALLFGDYAWNKDAPDDMVRVPNWPMAYRTLWHIVHDK
jgi:uncharacterized HAD superfamily protein